MLQTKCVKTHLLFKILLVAIKSPVRRTIGIIAPATRCKTEKFRSRIGLPQSCCHRWKSGAAQDSSVSQGTCSKKWAAQDRKAKSQTQNLHLFKRKNLVPVGEILMFVNIEALETRARHPRRGGQISLPTVLLIIGIEEN